MLDLIDISSLSVLLWSRRLVYGVPVVSVGELPKGRTPYTISYPVYQSDKDLMGNRDASHFQVHGRAYALAPESEVVTLSVSGIHPPDIDRWIYPYGQGYRRAGFCQLALPGHPYYWGTTVVYGHDERVPSYKAWCAEIEGRHAFTLVATPSLRWSPWPSDNYIAWDIDGSCARKASNGWFSAYFDPIDMSDYPLPEHFYWESATIECSRSYDSPSVIKGRVRINARQEDILSLRENYPKMGEMLVRDFIARIRIAVRDNLTYDSDPYCRPEGYFTDLTSKVTPNLLRSSWLCSFKQHLRTFAIDRKPVFDHRYLLSTATQSAADAARDFTGNTGTLIKELAGLKGSLIDLYKLLQGEVSPKNISSLYLTGKYGLRLTAQDTYELVRSVVRELKSPSSRLYSTARGSAFGSNSECHCKLYYDLENADAFSKAMFSLQSWDLFPSLENVWDIIPYSFVVDWFVDIEGFLQAIDARTLMSTMNIFRVLYSEKFSWRIDLSALAGFRTTGNVRCTYYTRWSQHEAEPVIPSFSGGQPSDHLIEGSALIIQHLTK